MPQFIVSTYPFGSRLRISARTFAITARRSGGRLARYAAGVVSLLETMASPRENVGHSESTCWRDGNAPAASCNTLPTTIRHCMSLIKYLANLGYGSRREVTSLVAARRVTRADGGVVHADAAFTHADLRVDGAELDPPPGSVLVLNKPAGYVCSTQDVPPLVYELLPDRFRRRTPIIAPIGRLDRDTTGLLLLTDDGGLNHRLTSPRAHSRKTYRATLANSLRGDEAERFASGTLMLSGETTPLAPAHLTVIDVQTIDLTITEGRYHQVRRMFAAVGNHVLTLHRTAIGAFTLTDLEPGAWRPLTDHERRADRQRVAGSTLKRGPSCTVVRLPNVSKTRRSYGSVRLATSCR